MDTPTHEQPPLIEEAASSQEPTSQLKRRKWLLPITIATIAVVAMGVFVLQSENSKDGSKDLGNAYSTDPVEKGKALANGMCSGTGSTTLTSAPMRTKEMSSIIPYGLMAAGHVTPIDHQYYWGKVQQGEPDMYDVLSPMDGNIVEIQYRDRSRDGGKVKGDYRVVISYSCTFFTYFDLATSLSSDILSQLPQAWDWKKNMVYNEKAIPVKAGQVVGKVGGQSLDFAVWDTTKPLKNFEVPLAYNGSEPWKIVTAPPLNYFSDSVKKEILPFYARTQEPLDGVIDQDVPGTLAGNWFKKDSYGYAGGKSFTGGPYWVGHVSFASDHIDPAGGYVFSTGDWSGEAKQFAIRNPARTPEKVTVTTGLVKYEVGQWNHTLNGIPWFGEGLGNITFSPGAPQGTVLAQMVDAKTMKLEVFPGKAPESVTAFTTAAATYTRGQEIQED